MVIDRIVESLSCILFSAGFSLFPAWSNSEAAHIIASFYFTQASSGRALQGREYYDAHEKRRAATTDSAGKLAARELVERSLTKAIKGLSSTNAKLLIDTYGSIRALSKASVDDLCALKGIGKKKAMSIRNMFTSPFSKDD
eukprot:gnl/Carplike_NY0171/11786_a16858_149.p1 GENE.gnl/Carplike_NY0171/11786_a16858_149~~gnl/Carplike_NY0171/11786_a16858_149.p1  ORF type:complete len:164 (-),score=21.78 gnl/Carplike_NY0171/11786_a16858_149:119-541(-)